MQYVSSPTRLYFLQEQASWVCECDESLVARLEHDFKTTLQQQNTLEQWAAWLEGVVHTVLEPYEGGGHEFTKAARQFLLKWSFYRYLHRAMQLCTLTCVNCRMSLFHTWGSQYIVSI